MPDVTDLETGELLLSFYDHDISKVDFDNQKPTITNRQTTVFHSHLHCT